MKNFLQKHVGWHKLECNNLLAVKLQVYMSHASIKDLTLDSKLELYRITRELTKYLPAEYVKYNFLVSVYYISSMLSKVKRYKEVFELVEYLYRSEALDDVEKYNGLLQR